ncbi:iron-containing alcohol dehydrogenase [Lonepinella koalarum]|uniref:iron-containing alcohol dehydrogenase n=1 Tax=Lonepinella koalarum TaxID=53417 RepID=UPI0011E3BC3F|nr:iron-containing alcohol dehydrogenase [Lonepinella koalarum]TYG33870.1 iron-containing alcohol dehydrogenase [Lonepinella koalarum]
MTNATESLVLRTTFTTRNFHGWGCLSVLPDEVARLGAKNVLIITDPFLAQSGLAQQIVQTLQQIGVSSVVNSDVVAEPPLAVAEQLVQFARQQNADLVIGLGGGSALDLAKLVAVLATQDGNVADYLNLTGLKILSSQGLAKIMIPTTAGTGSEVTNISVLSLASSKDVVVHDYLLADSVIVDPQLTVSVPARVTAATGIDALTHAIEAYVSVNATPISEGLSLQAIKLIARSLDKAVKNGNDRQARIDMSYGSYLAGLAFFNAGCAAVHALAYPLGGQFHIAHGESNAVLLYYVMGYIRSACAEKLKDIYQAMGFDVANLSAEEASKKCIIALKELVNTVSIPATLQDFNIPQDALDALSNDAIKQTRLLQRSPMLLSLQDIQAIYQSAFNGKGFI